MKILIVEFYATGHYMEYMKHIFNGLNHDDCNHEFIFYLNQKLRPTADAFLVNRKKAEVNYFSNQKIEKFDNCESSSSKSKFVWSTILEINKKVTFDHVIFMNINLIARGKFALNPLLKLPFTFSGIFFQSPYSLRKKGFRKQLVRIKREIILRLLILNKNCSNILLLNDKEGSEFYSKWSKKISFLVDPINLVDSSNIEIKNHEAIQKNNLIFTHIGALGVYKGSQKIIETFRTIYLNNPENLKSISIYFVGKMAESLLYEIEGLNSQVGRQLIIPVNKFVSEGDFSAYLQQSDCILIANKNVESSSGILNHALVRKKVMIAPNFGYYKAKLESYCWAYMFDNDFLMKDAILKVKSNFDNEFPVNNFNELDFYDDNSPKRFYDTLVCKLN